MPLRKDKKADKKADKKGDKKRDQKADRKGGSGGGARGGGPGDLAGLFGMSGMEGINDEDLEAELLALEGKSPGKKGGGKSGGKSGVMSIEQLDAMVAGIGDVGEEGEDEEGDFSDEDELLGELQELAGGSDEEPEKPLTMVVPPSRPSNGSGPSKRLPQPAAPQTSSKGSSKDLAAIQDRLKMYEAAVSSAQQVGDTAKARRYNRAITSINSMAKQAKAGKPVSLDDLPPEVFISGPTKSQGTAPVGVAAGGKDDFEISEEDLAAWANTMMDDREKTGPPPAAPKPTATRGPPAPAPRVPPAAAPRGPPAPAPRGPPAPAPRGPPAPAPRGPPAPASRGSTAMTTKGPPPPAPRPAQPAPPRPTPHTQAPPKPLPVKPGGLIDLDSSEFDDFNFSEEEFAQFSKTILDDRSPKQPQYETRKPAPLPPPPQPKPRASPSSIPPSGPSPIPRPQPQSYKSEPPRVQPKPQSKPPPMTASGMIDLDDTAFDEFNFSEDDFAALAGELTDDRPKKPKLEEQSVRPPPPTSSVTSPPRGAQIPVKTASVASDKQTLKSLLLERKQQYTTAMNRAKKQGNVSKGKEYGRMAVQFGRVLKAFEEGQDVDLSQMPGAPPGFRSSYDIDLSNFSAPPQTAPPPKQAVVSETLAQSSPAAPMPPQPEGEEIDPSIATPKTALEALEQRLAKYNEGLKSAQEKGESSRVRRTTRIVKQYEEAIMMTKAKKPYDYSELPAPPGFPPIPTTGARQIKQPVAPIQRPPVGLAPSQSLPAAMQSRATGVSVLPNPTKSLTPSTNTQEVQVLMQRKVELQTAAKQAKAKGDKETCLHYIKLYKGVESMIAAAQSGFPVNLGELPPSPFANVSGTKPSASVLSHLKPATEADGATFDLIETQLQKQIDLCDSNSDTYEKVGNLGPAQQYKSMSQNCQRELLAIKGIRSQGYCPPKFTIETRKFTIIHSHTDISSQQCEIEIVRAINVPRPSGYDEKELNIFIEIEFPWPSDDPQKATTESIRDSSSPEFKSQHRFDIDRKHNKSLLRIIKRTPVKCVLYQHRTLRKDLFLGQGLVSLEALETKCETHACVDLMDEKGRKPSGGKLEAVVRLREPMAGRDLEEKEEQWLVFQEAIAAKSTVAMPKPGAPKAQASGVNIAALSPVKVENTTSLEALKFEFSLVQNALKAGHKDTNTVQRGSKIQARLQAIKQRLQTESRFKQDYGRQIAREMQQEQLLEQQLLRGGRQTEVKILQGRRKVMEKELKSLK